MNLQVREGAPAQVADGNDFVGVVVAVLGNVEEDGVSGGDAVVPGDVVLFVAPKTMQSASYSRLSDSRSSGGAWGS